MRVAAVQSAFPEHYYEQETLAAALARLWSTRHYNVERLLALHRNARIRGRHLALPMHEYDGLDSFTASNDAYIRCASALGAEAVAAALERAGLVPADVDHFYLVSVTGVASPSVDVHIAQALGMSPHVRRVPIFGLGCVAGAAGLSRVAEVLRGHPEHVGVLLSVELCSLTLQRDDASLTNVVASGIFGDGAVAAVLVGAGRQAAGPTIEATRSVLYPNTSALMGWRIGEHGFRIVLSAALPQVVEQSIARDVDRSPITACGARISRVGFVTRGARACSRRCSAPCASLTSS